MNLIIRSYLEDSLNMACTEDLQYDNTNVVSKDGGLMIRIANARIAVTS